MCIFVYAQWHRTWRRCRWLAFQSRRWAVRRFFGRRTCWLHRSAQCPVSPASTQQSVISIDQLTTLCPRKTIPFDFWVYIWQISTDRNNVGNSKVSFSWTRCRKALKECKRSPTLCQFFRCVANIIFGRGLPYTAIAKNPSIISWIQILICIRINSLQYSSHNCNKLLITQDSI